MDNLKLLSAGLVVLSSLGLAGCGGGGAAGGAGTGTAANTSVGVVTGFGSVYVNGCEYETTSASISVDGKSATEDDLSVGDVVEVTGSAKCTKGSATHIKSADALEGWVDSVALDANGLGTLVVMGQTVTVNKMTVYEDATNAVATIKDIAANQIVEIHGFTSDQGTILATRIEVKATSLTGYLGELEVKGVVKNHNSATSTFNIGTLTVNYSAISPGFAITNDLFVEVKFNNSKSVVSIEIEDGGKLGYDGKNNDEVEISGVLASPLTNNTFILGEQKIQTTDSTEYKVKVGQPSLKDSLADASQVGKLYLEVEGQFVNGTLVAKSVKLEDDISDNKECKGTVSNLAATQGEMNAGNFTVVASSAADCAGQTSMAVTVNNNTLMEDDSSAHVSKFNLTYLRDGDTVEVYVEPSTGVAIKLERK